jgi:hypothetical protein
MCSNCSVWGRARPLWLSKSKVNVKCTLVQALRLCTGRTAHRESRGIALLFHDDGTRRGWGVSVTRRPLFTPPGKTRYPLYRRLCGPQGRSGQVRKISPAPGFDPRAVQPVASRYTDYATRPTCLSKGDVIMYGQTLVTSESEEHFGNFDKVTKILIHLKVWAGWCSLWNLDVFSSRYWLLLIIPCVNDKVTDVSRDVTAAFRK